MGEVITEDEHAAALIGENNAEKKSNRKRW